MLKKLGLLMVLFAVLGAVTVIGVMQVYQLSFTGLLNKTALKLNLVGQSQHFIAYQQRYQDLNVIQKASRAYPRIFLTQLRGWNGLTTPHFYQGRLDQLKSNRIGFRPACKKNQLKHQLHCFLALPSHQSMRKLEQLLIDYKLTTPTVTGSYGNSWLFAMVYDIAKASPYFSPAVSQVINTKISAMLQIYLELLDGDIASLWHGRSSLAANAFLLATVLEAETATQQMLYRRAYGHFNDVYQAIAATEVWPEGYNYWINTRAVVTVLALSALAEQQNITKANQIKKTISRIGLWHIYLTRPDFKIEGWGDEGPRIDLKDETAKVIDLIGQITGEVVFYQFGQVIRKKHKQDSYYYSHRWLLPFFYAASAVNTLATSQSSMSQLAGELKTSELFGANFSNHLSIRSDWGKDATFITYRAGHTFSHHQHYDAGHFSLFKGEPLAVNSSYYSGETNTDSRKNYSIRTIAKNSLLIQKTAEVVKPHRLFEFNVAAGGQRLVMPMGSAITSFKHWQQQLYQGLHVEGAKLLKYHHETGLYTAITSDLTAAYNSNRFDNNGGQGKVRRVERTLVYLNRQDMMLVYDNIKTIDPQDKTKWLLHTINKPIFARMRQLTGDDNGGIFTTKGETVTVVNKHSTMRVDILAPEQAKTLVIGGHKYRNYVEIDGDDRELNGRNIAGKPNNKSWFDAPQWRLEISPQQQELATHYLVTLQPRIEHDNAPVITPTRLMSTGVNATQFNKLLLLSEPRYDNWAVTLDSTVKELVIFVDKALRIKIGQAATVFNLEQGFNYLALTNELNGQVSIAIVDEF